MRARVVAWFLVGALVLLIELTGCGCDESCYTLRRPESPYNMQTYWAYYTRVGTLTKEAELAEQARIREMNRAFAAAELTSIADICRREGSNVLDRNASWLERRGQLCRDNPDLCVGMRPDGICFLTYTPTATSTRTPTPVTLQPRVGLPLASATPPAASATPPPSCIAPPILYDPPDGKNFAARNTVFRWKPGYELRPGEVYDILVSTDGGKTSKSIGTTQDTILPIDFLKWDFAGITTDFSWTVRVRDTSGKYVTCEGKWFSMILSDIPPAGNPVPVAPPACIPGPYTKCP